MPVHSPSQPSAAPPAAGQVRRHRGEARSYLAAKRVFDVLLAGAILILTAPLLLVVVIAIKCTSPGPVLYRARRAGRHGVRFDMLKFRTMRVDSDRSDRKITEARDDRVTWVGSLLRKTKIDEIPQLWNVLRGDMSIVGPRPEDIDLVERHYTPALRRALEVRPGIACSAEVRWYPDLTYHDPPPPGVPLQQHYIERHMPAQALEGVWYADHRSLALDLRILVQTVYYVLVRSWWPPPQKPLTSADLAGRGARGPGEEDPS